MRLLRAGLGPVDVRLRGHECRAEILLDLLPRGLAGDGRDVHAVRSHVGDETGLVELLGDHHRAVGREAAHARRGLLEGGRGERRIGMARLRLHLHRDDAQRRTVQVIHVGRRLSLVLHVRLFAVQARELGDERGFLRTLRGLDAEHPVRDGLERGDFALALDQEAQRDALHTPRAERIAVLEVPPQERGHLEAHQPVEDAARLLRVDARHVQRARVRHGGTHRVLRDFVVGDAVDGLALRDVGQHLAEMPGDGLSLTVGIGREENLVRGRGGLAQILDDLLLVRRNLVARRERPCVGFARLRHDLDRKPLLGEVPDMPDGRLDGECVAQVLRNRLRLRGRFHN